MKPPSGHGDDPARAVEPLGWIDTGRDTVLEGLDEGIRPLVRGASTNESPRWSFQVRLPVERLRGVVSQWVAGRDPSGVTLIWKQSPVAAWQVVVAPAATVP